MSSARAVLSSTQSKRSKNYKSRCACARRLFLHIRVDSLRIVEIYGILIVSAFRLHYTEKEVVRMETIFSFALSVAAGIVAYYICKWLDEQFKAGKH